MIVQDLQQLQKKYSEVSFGISNDEIIQMLSLIKINLTLKGLRWVHHSDPPTEMDSPLC